MENLIFKSDDVAKSGFMVFFDDKLVYIKLAKEFVKDTNRRLKQKFKEENNSFLARLMYTDDIDYWEAFPESFLDKELSEIQQTFSDTTLLRYADIRKFKLSGSYSTYDEGVQSNCPGELLIKGDGEKIAMDHNYQDDDPVYQKVLHLKKAIV